MDDYYKHLCDASDINMILDNINEIFNKTHKNMFQVCHGRYHAEFVVDTIEYILKSLSYDSRTVELAKVAALLHDIGMITGRWEHARKSAVLSAVIFDGSDHLFPDEKKMLVQAIEDHDKGKNISSVIGAALLIADKVDCSKNRVLPVGILRESTKNQLEIERVDSSVSDKLIIINFITTKDFSKEHYLMDYKKYYNLVLKGAEYLGCTCQLQFNGIDENFN